MSDLSPLHLLGFEDFRTKTDINHEHYQQWINGLALHGSDPFAVLGTRQHNEVKEALKTEMKRLDELLGSLYQLYEEVVEQAKSITRKKAILSPVRSIPTELLIKIFGFLPPAVHPHEPRRQKIHEHYAMVCRPWYNAFMGCSRLWRRILVFNSQFDIGLHGPQLKETERWLGKYRDHPLESNISGKHSTAWYGKIEMRTFPAIEAVLREFSCLSSLVLDFTFHDASVDARYLRDLQSGLVACFHAATRLQHLVIRLECYRAVPNEDEDENSLPFIDTNISTSFFGELSSTLSVNLPNLRSMIVRGDASQLISGHSLKSPSLLRLGIEGADLNFADLPSCLGAWVESFPRLDTLVFRDCTSPAATDDGSFPTSSLSQIHVEGTSVPYAFRTALFCHTSRLAELSVHVGYLRHSHLPELPSLIRIGVLMLDEDSDSEESQQRSENEASQSDSWVRSFLISVPALTAMTLIFRDSNNRNCLAFHQIMNALLRDVNSEVSACPKLHELNWTWRILTDIHRRTQRERIYVEARQGHNGISELGRSIVTSIAMFISHGISLPRNPKLSILNGEKLDIRRSRLSSFKYSLRNWSDTQADVIDASCEELAEAIGRALPAMLWPIPQGSVCNITNHGLSSHENDVQDHDTWCPYHVKWQAGESALSKKRVLDPDMYAYHHRILNSTWEGFISGNV